MVPVVIDHGGGISYCFSVLLELRSVSSFKFFAKYCRYHTKVPNLVTISYDETLIRVQGMTSVERIVFEDDRWLLRHDDDSRQQRI